MPSPSHPSAQLLQRLLPEAPPEAQAQASLLLSGLGGVMPAGLERSFKLTAKGLSAQRFLVSTPLSRWSEGALEELPDVLGMPAALAVLYQRLRPGANHLYLGFEDDAGAVGFKVYLEFPVRLRDRAGGPLLRQPGTQALGLKWSLAHPGTTAVTRYDLHPGLDWHEMLAALPAAGPVAPAAEVLKAALRMARGKVTPQALDFLRVSEPGLPRASWDVNLYPADLSVSALVPALQVFAASQGLPEHVLQQRCAGGTARASLGHVSVGTGRDGAPFVTLYHRCPP